MPTREAGEKPHGNNELPEAGRKAGLIVYDSMTPFPE